MKRTLIAFLLLSPLAAVGCGSTFNATSEFSLSAPWQDYERVEVRVRNGSVELRSGDVDEICISGTKRVAGYTVAEAERNLEQVTVYAGPHGDRPGTFLVELRYPLALRNKSVGATVVIQVPEPCAAQVDTSNGSIRVQGLRGEVVLDSSNGSLHVRDIEGSVRADTSNGRVEAEDITGDLRADTINGKIIAKRIQGSCVLETSNGVVHVEDVHGGVEIDTSNGSIRLIATPPATGRVVLRTSNGSIHVTLPADLAADLDFSTSNGRIKTALEGVTLRVHKRSKKLMRAAMNGGGCKVKASTSNGSITVDSQ